MYNPDAYRIFLNLNVFFFLILKKINFFSPRAPAQHSKYLGDVDFFHSHCMQRRSLNIYLATLRAGAQSCQLLLGA